MCYSVYVVPALLKSDFQESRLQGASRAVASRPFQRAGTQEEQMRSIVHFLFGWIIGPAGLIALAVGAIWGTPGLAALGLLLMSADLAVAIFVPDEAA
jgi:hypothetical protein